MLGVLDKLFSLSIQQAQDCALRIREVMAYLVIGKLGLVCC